MIRRWNTRFDEKAVDAVAQAVAQNSVSMGPVTFALEHRLSELLGSPYTICFSSGSAAYLSVLIALELPRGSTVLTPNRGWVNCINAHSILGLRSHVVDIQDNCPVIGDSELVEHWIYINKPKVVLITHINGYWAQVPGLRKAARAVNSFIIDDMAQSLGSYNDLKNVESDAQIYSLGITKLVSSGHGGFAQTNSSSLANNLVRVRTHGIDNPGLREEQVILGHNSRMSDLHSSIAHCMLDNLDERLDSCAKILSRYNSEFLEISGVRSFRARFSGEISIYAEFMVCQRDSLLAFLSALSIESTRLYHSLHVVGSHIHDITADDSQRNSEILDMHGICLPCGPSLTMAHQDFVIESVKQFFRGHSGSPWADL